MKNYDETIASVFSKIEDYNNERKRKKDFLFKTVTPLSCLCLVVVAVCVAAKGLPKTNAEAPLNSGIISNATSQQTQSDTENDINRTMFTLNRITGQIGAAKLNFSPDKYYSEVKDKNALKEYFGRDFTSLKNLMPSGFAYSGNETETFYYEHNGKIAYDTSMFVYTKDEATIKILVSKIGAPFDCVYNHKSEITPTEINGNSVIMGYKAIPINNEEQFEFVYADFSFNGLDYRIIIRDFERIVDSEKTEDMGICLYKLVKDLTE